MSSMRAADSVGFRPAAGSSSRMVLGSLAKAREILLQYRKGSTPVGIVSAAMRDEEVVTLTDLAGMLDTDITMQSTVIIGNSTTFSWRGHMITPRGYRDKYSL